MIILTLFILVIFAVGYATCSITVLTTPGTNLQQLYVSRLERNQEPVIMLAVDMPYPKVQNQYFISIYYIQSVLYIVYSAHCC